MSVRFEMRVPEAWLAAVDGGRGQVSRAAFVKAAVEQALAVSGAGPMVAAPAGSPVERQAAANDVKRARIEAARRIGMRPASSLEAKAAVRPVE